MEIKAKARLQSLIPALNCGASWAGSVSQLSHFLLSPKWMFLAQLNRNMQVDRTRFAGEVILLQVNMPPPPQINTNQMAKCL